MPLIEVRWRCYARRSLFSSRLARLGFGYRLRRRAGCNRRRLQPTAWLPPRRLPDNRTVPLIEVRWRCCARRSLFSSRLPRLGFGYRLRRRADCFPRCGAAGLRPLRGWRARAHPLSNSALKMPTKPARPARPLPSLPCPRRSNAPIPGPTSTLSRRCPHTQPLPARRRPQSCFEGVPLGGQGWGAPDPLAMQTRLFSFWLLS